MSRGRGWNVGPAPGLSRKLSADTRVELRDWALCWSGNRFTAGEGGRGWGMLGTWWVWVEGNWGRNCCDVRLGGLSGCCFAGSKLGCGGRLVIGWVDFLVAILVGGVKERFG